MLGRQKKKKKGCIFSRLNALRRETLQIVSK